MKTHRILLTLLLILAYFNNPCPQYYGNTYIPDSSYCSHQSTAEGSSLYYGERYARYRVGVTANQTVYIMSRARKLT